jgi:GLPGLI family protein
MKMKNILYILLLIYSFSSHAQTIKGIITTNPKKSIGDETVLSDKAKKPFIYSYIYSNKISLQELISEETTTIDTIIVHHDEHKELKMETTKALIRPFKTIHFKDYKSNTYRFESSRKNRYLDTENTSIIDKIPSYDWVLSKDTLIVTGYICKKATTDRTLFGRRQHITAWYCDEIPINDGPMAFNGLPGLILQIEIGEMNVIKFEQLKFFKDETVQIKEPKNEAPLLSINEYQLQVMNKN